MISTCSWRDKKIVPDDYEHIRKLVTTARRARKRLVQFDWHFSHTELLQFRDAVHHQGQYVTGRYKARSAHVLHAINKALGDPMDARVLREPRLRAFTFEVECSREGDIYWLRGAGPFDVIFGFGSLALDNAEWQATMGADLRKRILDAVAMLGWDVARLKDTRYVDVNGALFGEGPGSEFDLTAHTEWTDLDIEFNGPFSLGDADGTPSLLSDPIGRRSGVYLWVLNVKGNRRVAYVGQTSRSTFHRRIARHVQGVLSGEYLTLDADALEQFKRQPAPGAPARDEPWPDRLRGFLNRYEELTPHLARTIRMYEFYLAPLNGDRWLHDELEGELGRFYRLNPKFTLESAVFRVPKAISGASRHRFLFRGAAPVPGLPRQLPEIPS